MNSNTAAWLMHHLDAGDLDVGHASPMTKAWLEGLKLEIGLLRFLQWNWPRKACQIGPTDICPMEEVRANEDLPTYLKEGLFPVGWGPNGDVFAIDVALDSHPVGFVDHEMYDSDGDVRPHFEAAARSIESFLYRVAEGRYVPCDRVATASWNDFLREEASHMPYPPFPPLLAPPDRSNR